MKKLLLLLLLSMFLQPLYAQPALLWQKQYTVGRDVMAVIKSVKLQTNLYVHGGRYEVRQGPQRVYPFIIFTNAAGDSLYSFLYTAIDFGRISDLADNEDGTFMAYGRSVNANGEHDRFLLKLDYQGNLLWERHYLGASADSYGGALERLPDGYLLLPNSHPVPGAPTNFSVLKVDLTGVEQWRRHYGYPGADQGADITTTKDGSYMVLGITQQGSTVSGFYSPNYWLLEIKPNGDTIRSKIIGLRTEREEAYRIRQTSDGGFLIAGGFTPNNGSMSQQGQLVRLDSTLNIVWTKNVLLPFPSFQLTDVQETHLGDFLVVGTAQHPSGLIGLLAQVSNSGSVTWQYHFDPNNGAFSEIFFTMIYELDGSALINGGMDSPSLVQTSLVKFTGLPTPYLPNYCTTSPTAHFSYRFSNDTLYLTDSSRTHLPYDVLSRWSWDFGGWTSHKEGQQPQPFYFPPSQQVRGNYLRLTVTNNLFCTDTLTFYPWGLPPVAAPEQQPLQVQVYPNPAQELVQFVLPLAGERAQLQLYNGSGQLVRQQTLQPGQNQLSLQGLPQGLYLYHLQQGVRQQRGKLVKQE